MRFTLSPTALGKLPLLACAFLAFAVSPVPHSLNAAEPPLTVTVSSTPSGRTPAVIGYNMGDNFPGSNVSSWLRYSELRGARFWWAQEAWPATPPAWPTGSASLARFESERARLRADPLAGADRGAHAAAIAQTYGGAPVGTVGDCFSLSELHKLGADILVMLGRPTSRHAFETADGSADWFGRWAYWRGVYLNAFYLAQHYGVARFQLFNEPDHPNSKHISQSDYLRRLQLGSDAAQAAVADVNRLFHRSLRPQISAPVSAGLLVFSARSDRPDTRDAQTGWGELIVGHRHDAFPGRSEPTWPLFHTYAFQYYGREPARITSGLTELRGLITTANAGTPLPIIVSEMNVSTAANFSKTADTLDTPSYYAPFGAVAAAYLNAGIDEVYVFRLTQNDYAGAGGVKKNGTHLLVPGDARKNILRNTKGAEAVRLFMRGFTGARTRLAPPTAASPDVHTAAARDDATGTHTVMLANLKQPRSLALDLAAWKLPPGALVVVDEVSATHHGDVRSATALPADHRLTLSLGADSVILLTVYPRVGSTAQVATATRAPDQTWLAASPSAESKRVLLAVRGTAPSPQLVRVYAGPGDLAQADLLGHVLLGASPEPALIDVTRHLSAHPGQPTTFRFVAVEPDARRAAFSVESVELRSYAAAP